MRDAAATLVDELSRHVADQRVLAAIAAVPRERFVTARQTPRAYANRALAIGCGQTISQPLVVARMAEVLELAPTDRVLDVGTGSGYHAAVLAALSAHVWSIERHERLSRRAARNLDAAGVRNVTLTVGDGTRGLRELAPFDAVNVGASGPSELLDDLATQLTVGGRMVAPICGADQRLVLVRRTAAGLTRTALEEVRFVPLIRD